MNALTSYALAAFCLLGQVPVETPESLGQGILLTDSGKLYEGKIDHLGNLYRVMSGGRSEMVRDANVLFTGQTRDDAYEFLKTKKKPDVAEDCAKLADWCKLNGLPKEAVIEAKLAVKLAPDDRAFAKLLQDCETFSKMNRPVIRVVGSGLPPKSTAKTVAASAVAASPIPAPAITFPTTSSNAPAQINSTKPEEVEKQFAKQVQPVFMNLCANCHADPVRQVNYRLKRLPEGILVSPNTRENVAASLLQIRKDQPQSSPLINYAITPHGGKDSPPMNRATTAYKNLEAWVALAASTLPDTANTTAVAPVAQPTPAKSVIVVGASNTEPLRTQPATPEVLPPLTATPTAPQPTGGSAAGSSPVKAVDPFDPAEFNKPTNGTKKQ